jgi:hypothetical protein
LAPIILLLRRIIITMRIIIITKRRSITMLPTTVPLTAVNLL